MRQQTTRAVEPRAILPARANGRRLVCERLEQVYGQAIGSHDQNLGLALSKRFRPFAP